MPAQKPFTLWADLACVVAVERVGTRKGEPHAERAFYISSRIAHAQELGAVIRGHWGIENRLHWVKDVVMKEDACTTRAGNAPQNWGVLRNWAVTLFRLHGWQSITGALRRFAHDVPALFHMLLQE